MRVERLRQDFAVGVTYRHFPLHPDTPEDGLTLEALFAGRDIDLPAAQVRMMQLMSDEGIPYGQRTMTFNSRLAQEFAMWAETQQDGYRIHDAIFQAYFVDNINLAKIQNLVTIAERIGLPTDEARSVLDSRRYREDVDSDWQRSHELGITGVPTFVIGNQAIVGAQSYEQLAQFAASAGAESRRAKQ